MHPRTRCRWFPVAGQNTGWSPAPATVNPSLRKYSYYRNSDLSYFFAHPGLPLRGDHVSSRFASRACGGRGGVGRERPRAGRIALREPEASCQMSGAVRFVSPAFFRQGRQRREIMRRTSGPCVRQNRVVLTVVATVKLLRRRHSRQPARCPRISLGRGRPERTRLPGERGISRQTTAQGRPCVGLHLYAAVRFPCASFRAADRGC